MSVIKNPKANLLYRLFINIILFKYTLDECFRQKLPRTIENINKLNVKQRLKFGINLVTGRINYKFYRQIH